jgi:Zinc carboxypeptidase
MVRRSPGRLIPIMLALSACAESAPADGDGSGRPSSSPSSSGDPAVIAAPEAAPAPPPEPAPAAPFPSTVVANAPIEGDPASERGPGRSRSFGSAIRDAYKDPEELEAALRAHHRRRPDLTELVVLGSTHASRPILALKIGRGLPGDLDRPAVLLNGSHHGDEPLSTEFVLDAIGHLLEPRTPEDPRVARWLDTVVIWCVPMVNPDGAWAFMENFGAGRKNARDLERGGQRNWQRGVDLNRNYPFRWGSLGERAGRSDPTHRWYRGPSAGSEPETQAMMRLGDAEHFVGSISFHIGTVALLAPYTIDGVRSPSPNEAWIVAEEIVAQMPRHPELPLRVKRNLYPVDGTDPDWHRAAHGTVALLFEGAQRSWESEEHRRAAINAVRPSWMLLLDRFLDGPSISGHVRDAAGAPIMADVKVLEVAPMAGEAWRSRCRDGRFDRYLPAPGRYTVRVQIPGAPAVEKKVEVGRGRATVDVTFPEGAAPACRP